VNKEFSNLFDNDYELGTTRILLMIHSNESRSESSRYEMAIEVVHFQAYIPLQTEKIGVNSRYVSKSRWPMDRWTLACKYFKKYLAKTMLKRVDMFGFSKTISKDFSCALPLADGCMRIQRF
jgi:hypothetical protein